MMSEQIDINYIITYFKDSLNCSQARAEQLAKEYLETIA